jgi:uracil phosphoribosyltransferase
MENIKIVDNMVLKNALTNLRDKNLKSSQVRKQIEIIAKILLIEALKNEKPIYTEVETPLAKGPFEALEKDKYVIVPILRAGLSMIIVDPMVATGGSLEYAISVIKKHNPEKIISLNIVVSPEGIRNVSKFEDVLFYIGQIDKGLNNKGYIIPGIGDAGG